MLTCERACMRARRGACANSRELLEPNLTDSFMRTMTRSSHLPGLSERRHNNRHVLNTNTPTVSVWLAADGSCSMSSPSLRTQTSIVSFALRRSLARRRRCHTKHARSEHVCMFYASLSYLINVVNDSKSSGTNSCKKKNQRKAKINKEKQSYKNGENRKQQHSFKANRIETFGGSGSNRL